MSDLADRIYEGDGKGRYEPLNDAWQQPEPYIAAPALAEAVNVALYLRRPLLVEGEPGCGKTQLAYAVAYELGYPLKTCYIRSTTRAQDLLYTYDAVRRLYDIQEPKNGGPNKLKSRREYVELGRLGEAIELAQNDIPSVVLIDEIDKADIDFPNDLLLVLDRLQFEVTEVEQAYGFDALKGKARSARKDCLPLIIVTSNREKELPKPFLRRCLYYYIDFPGQETLEDIIRTHFQQPNITPLFGEALKKFWALREQKQFGWRKIPGTSELRRRNQAGLLLLIDRQGSMAPFSPFVDALIESVLRAGMLGRVHRYYFHDCPKGVLFTQPNLTQSVSLQEVLSHQAKDNSVLVVSDAGAARGDFDRRRIEDTRRFVETLGDYTYLYAWLNPVPARRWSRTTAAEITRLAPMFPLDRDGLSDAIKVLRGKPYRALGVAAGKAVDND